MARKQTWNGCCLVGFPRGRCPPVAVPGRKSIAMLSNVFFWSWFALWSLYCTSQGAVHYYEAFEPARCGPLKAEVEISRLPSQSTVLITLDRFCSSFRAVGACSFRYIVDMPQTRACTINTTLFCRPLWARSALLWEYGLHGFDLSLWCLLQSISLRLAISVRHLGWCVTKIWLCGGAVHAGGWPLNFFLSFSRKGSESDSVLSVT